MTRLVAVLLIAALGLGAAGPPAPLRVLMVGNSLTYYHAMPELTAALLRVTRGAPVEIEVLAAAGASLREHLDEGALAVLLGRRSFDVVVFQEVGGFPDCDPGFPGCAGSAAATEEIAALIRHAGARPVWYSTWQPNATAQRHLSEVVRARASSLGVELADAGAMLARVSARRPDWVVLRADGHPEPLGSWVIAATLAAAIAPSAPTSPTPRTVCAPDWTGMDPSAARPLSEQPRPPERCSSLQAGEWAAIAAAVRDPP